MNDSNTKQISLKTNAVMNIVLTMSSFIFPLISFPYATRILTPVGTGKVSFALSFISYFSMFAQLGIPTYGIRACAKVRDNKSELTRVTHELLFINLFTNIISYTCLAFALIYIPRVQQEKELFFVVSCTIFLTSIGVEWLYKGLEQYTYITIRSVFFKFVSLIGLFLLVHSQDDYVIYGGITIFATSASNILNFINIRKYVYLRPIGGYDCRRHLKAVLTFFAMACATTIYTNLDTVMLGFIKTDAEVGFYNVAIKIKNILVSVVTSLGAVLLPRASYCIEHGQRNEFKHITEKAFRFVIFVAVPTMVYFFLFAKEVILFLSGPAYEPAIAPMQFLMPTVLLIGITNLTGLQILVPLGLEKKVLCSELIGAIVDVVLNACLIPTLGAAGAAIGTLIAEISVLIFQVSFVKKMMKDFSFSKRIFKYIFLSIICGGVSIWIKCLNLNNFIYLCISASIFFSAYLISLYLIHDENVKDILTFVKEKIIR